MAVQIGAKPDSGFDDPIGMLKDCHRRIEHFLSLLHIIAARAYGRALTAEERHAVTSALIYFNESGPRHTHDEEDSLFPRIRHLSPLRDEIARLETDHQLAIALHGETSSLYDQWIKTGALTAEGNERLCTITDRLTRLYRDHIRIEEEHIFAEAATVLDTDTLRAIGSEFKHRRA